MYRNKLKAPTVQNCRFRCQVRQEKGVEVATCRLLKLLAGVDQDDWCKAGRDACEACCKSFPPSPRHVNPVVASLLYDLTSRLIHGAAPAGDLRRIEEAREAAVQQLELAYTDGESPSIPKQTSSTPLARLVPPPPKRGKRRVQSWAVGVTTAPRREATLESCLESVVRAGWRSPYLFVDAAVNVPRQFVDLPGTFRDEKIGAWPSYYLGLVELLMRQPRADAYMIVQDDVVFCRQQKVRGYLEEVLWPGDLPGLVSLYCPGAYTQTKPGWHVCEGCWGLGALAFVFPREIAKAFVTDRSVFEHRWTPDDLRATSVDGVIGIWAADCGLQVWFPTPSLVQHIGEASTLWPAGRASGPHRRAEWFAGDWP